MFSDYNVSYTCKKNQTMRSCITKKNWVLKISNGVCVCVRARVQACKRKGRGRARESWYSVAINSLRIVAILNKIM